MTPLMYSSAPGVVKSRLRYARRLSSVDSTPIESKRFLMVPLLSSAARIPFPSATSALAVSCRSFAAISFLRLGSEKVFRFRLPSAATVFSTEPPQALRFGPEGRRCGGAPLLLLVTTRSGAWRIWACPKERCCGCRSPYLEDAPQG